MTRDLTIREMAERSGFSGHTLRYYERIGLIRHVARHAGGQRRYAVADVAWLEFLRRLRSTGMPIRQMKRFADLRYLGDATVTPRREMLEAQASAVAKRIAVLSECQRVLTDKIAHYRTIECRSAKAARGRDSKEMPKDAKPIRPRTGKAERDRPRAG
jgi:DNA-binding transcriptional MerR regulator